MAPRPDPVARRVSGLAIAALACLVLFAALGVLVRIGWTPLTDLDRRIATDLHRTALGHPAQVTLWKDVSNILSPSVLRIAAVVVGIVVLVWRRAVDGAGVLIVAVVATWPLSLLGKLLVDRDRPSFAQPVAHAAGQSYPSGHALTSFVAFAAVLVVAPRARRVLVVPCVVLIAAVGFSRLFLGVHYLTDVAGGWLLGAAELGLVVLMLRGRRAVRLRKR